MDLSTLDSLLKGHVDRLGALYGQLGAPQDTVNNRLQELHNALIGTVNQQLEDAKLEVAAVEQRVAGLEAAIARKQCRLGSEGDKTKHARSATETLVQAQERLEKEDMALEKDVQGRERQFASARAVLVPYVTSLGEVFLASIQAENTPAASAEADLSLVCLKALEKQASLCKAELAKREATLRTLLTDIAELWGELGLGPAHPEGKPSDCLGSPVASTSSADGGYDQAILQTIAAFDMRDASKHAAEPAADTLKPDPQTLQTLAEKRTRLETERDQRMQEIQDLYDQLYALWSRLGVTDAEADDFVEVWKGCEQRCIDAYRAELERMTRVKAENMALFIQREREELSSLWDQLFYSEEERSAFSVSATASSDEDVLLAYENERARLTAERDSKDTILKSLSRYFSLLDEIRQLEESANDPSRLTGRGQRGDPGRLLREEKQRKRVAKEKPKLEQDLMQLIPLWEEDAGRPFLIGGTRLIDDLRAKVDNEQTARPPSRRARAPPPAAAPLSAQSVPPSAKRQVPTTGGSQSRNLASTVKRPRVGTDHSSAQLRANEYAIARPNGSTLVPSTPCPQPQAGSRQIGMLLGSSTYSQPPTFGQNKGMTGSRLPLKAGFSISTTSAPAAAGSLFSPAVGALAPLPKKSAFRPRPSNISVSTVGSSAPSFASFDSRMSRTPSCATSVESTDLCS